MRTRDRIYQAIVDFIDQNGMSPTIREICMATQIDSNSQVFFHIRNLESEGRLVRHPFKARGIEVPGMTTTSTARDGALLGRMIVEDAQPTSAGYVVVSGDLINALHRWVERVGA